jgi:hypothetical protein
MGFTACGSRLTAQLGNRDNSHDQNTVCGTWVAYQVYRVTTPTGSTTKQHAEHVSAACMPCVINWVTNPQLSRVWQHENFIACQQMVTAHGMHAMGHAMVPGTRPVGSVCLECLSLLAPGYVNNGQLSMRIMHASCQVPLGV